MTDMTPPERSVRLAEELRRRILVLDGAMGTMIQARGLGPDDFGGARYEGCNEHLNLTRPDVITLAAARLCRAAADRASTAERPRFAVGAMGPGTRTITVTANVTFDEVRDGYYRQARALIEGRVHALLRETCQDTLNVKAAAIGVKQAMAEAGVTLPLMVSPTVDPMGPTLAGPGVDAR